MSSVLGLKAWPQNIANLPSILLLDSSAARLSFTKECVHPGGRGSGPLHVSMACVWQSGRNRPPPPPPALYSHLFKSSSFPFVAAAPAPSWPTLDSRTRARTSTRPQAAGLRLLRPARLTGWRSPAAPRSPSAPRTKHPRPRAGRARLRRKRPREPQGRGERRPVREAGSPCWPRRVVDCGRQPHLLPRLRMHLRWQLVGRGAVAGGEAGERAALPECGAAA